MSTETQQSLPKSFLRMIRSLSCCLVSTKREERRASVESTKNKHCLASRQLQVRGKSEHQLALTEVEVDGARVAGSRIMSTETSRTTIGMSAVPSLHRSSEKRLTNGLGRHRIDRLREKSMDRIALPLESVRSNWACQPRRSSSLRRPRARQRGGQQSMPWLAAR